MKKLTRIPDGGSPGVCAGLSKYFNIDVTIVRLLFIFGTIFTALYFSIVYLILLLIVPEEKQL